MLPAERRPWAVGLALLAALGWLYADVVSSLVRQWASDDNYSHGFLVVPLALFFAWERRDRLLRADYRPHAAGLVLIAGSLLVLLAGLLGAELFLTRISLVGLIGGIVLFVWGREHFRILAFPIAFLVLMVPLPEIIFNQVAFPLQLVASRAGEAAIAAAGIPVLREGNVLHLPGRSLEVAEACSGIRSLVSLIMLGIVLGYFTESSRWTRLFLTVSAIPIAILANATRVGGTGLLSHWVGPAAADGFFHSFSGWIVFLVALGGLVLVQRLISVMRFWQQPRPQKAALGGV
jgi:exosortase